MKIIKCICGLLLSMSLAVPVLAQDVTISLSLGENPSIQSAHYFCGDGTERTVKYLSGRSNQFALLSINEESLVFVHVISGSGSRYISGPYEWWIKGNEGTLTNSLIDNGKVECTEKVVGDD